MDLTTFHQWSYTLNEGHTLHDITCSAICVPECTYSWKRSYTVITNTNVLSVGSVKRGDTGIYECAARTPTSGQIVNSQSVEILIRCVEISSDKRIA
ncbi:hypothetical protein DPMN_127221 [Dreissena polymorpha]|uniref:Ig-like domain-containing protein n=1 Tax=Dreissena polymorpha TaxID=45954 RepID=A0A9D4GX97_DREPO|nr:hypothetical protein DPMN_127221 [Dreissena polymorpha]